MKARDAAGALAVETGSEVTGHKLRGVRSPDNEIEGFALNGVSVLKNVVPGSPDPLPHSVHALIGNYIARYPEQVLQADKHYVWLLDRASDEWRIMDCGIFEDSPSVREELQRGFAENDMLPSDLTS
ncbi:MAG TPA: hypothetical protein VGN16_03760 [Acidobacteriaceae bacterium]